MTFQSTMWTLIGQAKDGSRAAMEKLFTRYRSPILQYLRGRGLSDHDAEDVAQEVFLEISQDAFLQSADRTKGKFRTLLLRVTQHVLASSFRKKYSAKRGGDRTALSVEDLEEVPATRQEEDRFNEIWARHLIQMGMERLQRDAMRLKVPYYEVMKMRFLEGKSNAEIADKLRCKAHDVENYLYHGKQRLKKVLLDFAREYCSTAEEHTEETELLKRYLP